MSNIPHVYTDGAHICQAIKYALSTLSEQQAEQLLTILDNGKGRTFNTTAMVRGGSKLDLRIKNF